MEQEHNGKGPVAVAVITPSGIFPTPDDYRRAYGHEIVKVVLDAAANELKIKDTSDWDAYVDNEPIDPGKSFAENGLCGVVEIEWHKREGGGGA
ncbi:hypothetical protein [Burkholderia gladioli]|uniref:hypothetical protein n=1 Tax=Burkholderia gladioli TaxID=28095 RepID=UPI0005BBCA8A|nr:hypothetical protein [Burkholderia gladioli]